MTRLMLALLLILPLPVAAQGVVSAADPRATAAGQEMLRAGGSATDAAIAMAEAQVHATLALASATAIQITDQYLGDDSDETETIAAVNEWHETAVRGRPS